MKATNTQANITNEIVIDANGNCTVIGSIAHALWDYGKGEFPRARCCSNNYYVMEPPCELAHHWTIRAGQSSREGAMKYMASDRVLIDVSSAPIN